MGSYVPNKRFLASASVFSGVCARHSFLMRDDGDVYGMGENSHGQLGIGSRTSPDKLEIVPFFESEDVSLKRATCGSTHTLFLLTNGQVWSCGRNTNEQLGLGDWKDRLSPERVVYLDDICIIDVICGHGSSFCLSDDGRVFSFGVSRYGLLGTGKDQESVYPCAIKFPNDAKIIRISAGGWHAAAVDETGTLYTWGGNFYGQLGRKDDSNVPMRVKGLPLPRKNIPPQVICGGHHTTVAYSGDEIFSFGFNKYGEMGIGRTVNQPKPVRVEWFNDQKAKKLAIGEGHTIAITKSGRIISFGWNRYFQLCVNDKKSRISPVEVPFTEICGVKIVDVICGYTHTLLVTEDGSCYGIGQGANFGAYEHLKKPKKLLVLVGLGQGDDISKSVLNIVFEEQYTPNGDERTTDMCLWMRNSVEKHPIMLHKALVDARCENIKDGDDIIVEQIDEETKEMILKIIYTDKVRNRKKAAKIREMLGIRSLSIQYCMSLLYRAKNTEGDVTITSKDGSLYKAHKFILVARSSYFHSLFLGGWRETSTNTVALEMTLDDTFDVYLKWLYTGLFESTHPQVKKRFNEYIDYFGS